MSMLIQNIETKTRIYYLLGSPFLNQLILHDFEFSKDDELVDYYVNFLKSLSIKLDGETVNFFFNDKLKTFPLFNQAIMFYNHKDQLVRTSIQSITLTLFNIDNPEMQGMFSVLPFCQFFSNIVCRLREIWMQIDGTIESISQLETTVNVNSPYKPQTNYNSSPVLSVEKQIEVLTKLTEDGNEILFYVQDIFTTCKDRNNRVVEMMANALLNYAYLPVVVQSLCVLKLKPHLQISSCLYILIQSFHILKEKQFCTTLFKAIFSSKVDQNLLQRIEA